MPSPRNFPKIEEQKEKKYLRVDEVDVEREIGELNCALRELNVELVEVDFAEDELAQFLLEEELANPLEGPPRERGLR